MEALGFSLKELDVIVLRALEKESLKIEITLGGVKIWTLREWCAMYIRERILKIWMNVSLALERSSIKDVDVP